MGKDDEGPSGVSDERQINEEHKTWKQNTSSLYDLLIIDGLEWPSLTVQWLPFRTEFPDKGWTVQELILGTNAWKNEPNYLMLAQVKLHTQDPDMDEPGPSNGNPNPQVQIVQTINQDGEVNRARYMPQNPFFIATKTVSAEVYVFDRRRHPSKRPLHGPCNPDLRLRGHSTQGYGLSWSPFKQGHLLSGSDDAKICLWDINAVSKDKALDAMQTFKVHEGIVEDVAWHQKHENVFGSVGNDHYLHIWDLRASQVTKPSQSVAAHQSSVNCLAFNPFNEWVLVTGSSDKTVKLFDLRKLSSSLHTLDSHEEEIFQVGWSPQHETMLGSSCLGRRLLVWDLGRIGEGQTLEDAEDGPPELIFVHGGHTKKISDFSWNQCEDWVVASVDEDNILQVWQMADHVYLGEETGPRDDAIQGSDA